MEIAEYVDHTYLKAAGPKDAIVRLCREAREMKCASVCVNPSEVAQAVRLLKGSGVKVGTVIGFPLGATTLRVKSYEALDALQLGAEELDFVVNQRLLKYAPAACEKELIQIVRACRGFRTNVVLKLILECCNLTKKEIALGCRLAQKTGFDFVKTSTGFGTGGATLADVKLMYKTVGAMMGVKAAGGIRDKATALAMLKAGATRIGSSAGKALLSLALAAGLAFGATAADLPPEELVKKQARSVHLSYAPIAEACVSATATCTVTETQTNSYFMILGWDCGYCGIQDLGAHGRVLIFSVWDPGDPFNFAARPDDMPLEKQVKVLSHAPDVDVARFGGEGTGARTLTRLPWKVGQPVSVRIDTAPYGDERASYTCYLRDAHTKKWRPIATLATLRAPEKGRTLNGLHSFVEDFWRNYASAKLSRRAEFSKVYSRGAGTTNWVKAVRARFTGDATPSTNVDAGLTPAGDFFLQTGGATVNSHVKLWGTVE